MKKTQKTMSFMFIFVLIFTYVFGSVTTVNAAESNSTIKFFDLNVIAGGDDYKGNAILVQSYENGQPVYGLIDAGTYDAYENHVKSSLSDILGNKKLSFVLVTHLDVDHMGGICGRDDKIDSGGVIDEFCNENTVLYIKDVKTSLDSRNTDVTKKLETRYSRALNKAKAKKMPIAKIRPLSSISGINTVAEINKLNNNEFKTTIDYLETINGAPYSKVRSDNKFQLGRFTITLYNGNNWGMQPITSKTWDENANSVTVLLTYISPSGKKMKTYLGADLGENSPDQYSQAIAEQAVKAMGSNVSILQVPHHGYYRSMNNATAEKLNCKYAIVTNSYKEIAETGLNYWNKPNANKDNETNWLAFSTRTIKNLFGYSSLKTVYFTSEENNGSNLSDGYRLISELTPDKGVTVLDNLGRIKNGTVTAVFGTDDTLKMEQ